MRKTYLLASLIYLLLSACTFAAGGVLPGAGTEANPFLIEDVNDFETFATDSDYWANGIQTKLMTDIDLSGRTYTTAVIAPDTDNTNGQSYDGTPFKGVFDGNNHLINNLTINSTNSYFLGLFGRIEGVTSEIRNLYIEGEITTGSNYVGGLAGVNAEGTISGCHVVVNASGGSYIGGLVGYNTGLISDCNAVVSLNNDYLFYTGGLVGWNTHYGPYSGLIIDSNAAGSITSINGERIGGLVGWNDGDLGLYATTINCFSSVTITGKRELGGLVGRNRWATVNECYATGSVTGTDDYVGGLVGMTLLQGAISNCYATGSVSGDQFVGGLVGRLRDESSYTVSNCYATGFVAGRDAVGGLVGWFELGEIFNCFSAGTVSGDTRVGGLVGYDWVTGVYNCFWDINTSETSIGTGYRDPDPAGVVGKTTAQMQTLSTFTVAGWDFIDIWNIGENQTYPYLRTYSPADVNKDGIVNLLDLSITCERWLEER